MAHATKLPSIPSPPTCRLHTLCVGQAMVHALKISRFPYYGRIERGLVLVLLTDGRSDDCGVHWLGEERLICIYADLMVRFLESDEFQNTSNFRRIAMEKEPTRSRETLSQAPVLDPGAVRRIRTGFMMRLPVIALWEPQQNGSAQVSVGSDRGSVDVTHDESRR